MTLIEGHWETINNLSDIARIVREYYNQELADKIDEFAENEKEQEKRYSKLNELFNLINDVKYAAESMEDLLLDI